MGKRQLLIPLAILIISCSSKLYEQTTWQESNVTVDASASEYGNLRNYDSETKMLYSISNDSTNIYFCFATTDENIQRQIMMAGMEVWIDTTRKSKQEIGIKYPRAGSSMPIPQMNMVHDTIVKPDQTIMRKNFLSMQKVAEMKGFRNIPNGLSPLETASGLKIKMAWDTNETLIYEIQIPLRDWYKEYSRVDSAKLFTLTVNVNAIQMPNMGGPPGGGGFGGSPPGGMGGGPGGSPPPDGQMGGMMEMTQPHSFKTNFKLNTNAK